jgi:hypothetical protein
VPPKITQPKEVGIPKWLRVESEGVADSQIAKLTMEGHPESPLQKAGGKKSESDQRGGGKSKSSPRNKRRAPAGTTATAAGAAAGVVTGLNWNQLFLTHGRMTIGAPK